MVDGNGRRIGKRVDGVLEQGFLWDGTRPIAELDGGGQVVSRFVYATHPNVPDLVIRGGETYRIVADHLGSPRLVVNVTTGAVAQRLRYDAFGNVEEDTAPGFQPFGFAGGLYDPDTELVRFGARDYDPRSGRWTARDPILFLGQDTNLYLYAYGDPVNFVDPDGLAGVWTQRFSNFVAGFGDLISFGLTKWIRDQWEVAFDLGPTVYPCHTGFYTGGQVAGDAVLTGGGEGRIGACRSRRGGGRARLRRDRGPHGQRASGPLFHRQQRLRLRLRRLVLACRVYNAFSPTFRKTSQARSAASAVGASASPSV